MLVVPSSNGGLTKSHLKKTFLRQLIEVISKKRILVQYQGGREFQTDGVAVTAIAGILQYFEDLNRASNAEIGPKDFFAMTSNVIGKTYPGRHLSRSGSKVQG